MKSPLLPTLLTAVLLAMAPWSAADEPAPIATISLAGYNALLANLDFLGKLGGNPNLAKSVEGMIRSITQDQGLDGIDPERPWCMVAYPHPASVVDAVIYLPITDMAQLLATCGTLGLPCADAGDGVTEILSPVGLRWYIKQRGDWAVVAQEVDRLNHVPDNPIALLGGVEQRYVLAARLLLDNIAPELKQMVLGHLSLGLEQGLEQDPDETAPTHALRTRIARQSLREIATRIDDIEAILIGLSLDTAAQKAHLDLEITATAGSPSAKGFASLKPARSAFAGFIPPEAAATAHWVGVLSEADITRAKDNIEDYRASAIATLDQQQLSENVASKAKQWISEALGLVMETIETRDINGAVAAMLEPGAATLIAASTVADGAKVDRLLRDIARTSAAESPELAKTLQLDAATHASVTLHALSLPIAEIDGFERIVRMVGDRLVLVVGTDAKHVWLAVGHDAMARLTAAIDRAASTAASEAPPVRMTLAVTPVAQFVAATSDDELMAQQAAMLAMMVQQAGSENHVTLTAEAIPNGIRQRLEIETGLLRVLGAMSQLITIMGPR